MRQSADSSETADEDLLYLIGGKIRLEQPMRDPFSTFCELLDLEHTIRTVYSDAAGYSTRKPIPAREENGLAGLPALNHPQGWSGGRGEGGGGGRGDHLQAFHCLSKFRKESLSNKEKLYSNA